MPPRKTVAGSVLKPASVAPTSGSVMRTVAPVIPLAIALLHGVVAGVGTGKTPGPGPVAQGPTVMGGEVSGNTLAGLKCGGGTADSPPCAAPVPMLAKGHPVDWFFVFKLNTQAFPECGGGDTRTCPFGGTPTLAYGKHFGQQFVYASAEAPALQDGGKECLGTTTADPVGATFDEVYNGNFHYVVWNDQFKGSPTLPCGANCDGPWGHSKGILAWNDAGEGLVMQVSTPSWPGSGNAKSPRVNDGNTLGCVTDDDVEVSQHFFALHLTPSDLLSVLEGLSQASVATSPEPKFASLVSNGGPEKVQDAVRELGTKSASATPMTVMLSTGVEMISKPSALAVPPWQMVSSLLGGAGLYVANWWTNPDLLASTTAENPVEMGCWDDNALPQKPGPVVNATAGVWNGVSFGLLGGPNPNGNHAKVAVTTTGTDRYAIFGDMNQEGSYVKPNCDVSQNGRGGTFYVVKNAQLAASVGALIGAPGR